MPTVAIIPEEPVKRRPAFEYLILDLDDRGPPPGYEPKEVPSDKGERGVCIIDRGDED